MKKRLLAMLLVMILCISVVTGCAQEGAETAEPAAEATAADEPAVVEEPDYTGVQLVVCTWGGATGSATKEIAAAFEEEYGCEIIIDEVNSNTDRLAKLQAQISAGVVEDDVVYLSGSFAKQAQELGLLEKIDPEVVTTVDELYDFAKNDTGYGPMVAVGRFGLMYNAAMLEELGLEPPTSYMDLFDDKYAGIVSLPAMTSTAGPYVLGAVAEELGGDLENYQVALDLYKEKKDNIKLWYTSDIIGAMAQKEVAITVYMDLLMPILVGAGLDMVWVDAEEGNFGDPVNINVVKDAPNKELAQLFVDYTLQKSTQELFLELNNEAPTNKNAVMSEDQQAFLAYGPEAFEICTFFDYDQLNALKPILVEEWQKIVAE
jgi:putative spermidine/putrescine transport system substrate-binding protein